MAPWQAEFHLVPRRALAGAVPTADRLREGGFWRGVTTPPDLGDRLSAIARPASAPAPGVERWGAEDGDRVDLVRSDDGGVRDIVVQVDVRRADPKFSAGILLLARATGCVLVRADGRVAEPIVGQFAAALKSSAAWRLAGDPTTRGNGRALDLDEE